MSNIVTFIDSHINWMLRVVALFFVVLMSGCSGCEEPKIAGIAGKIVSGYVQDKNTNEPIANARVILLGHDADERTDSAGHFYLDVNGCIDCLPGKSIRLNISSPQAEGYGYHDVLEPIDSDSRVIIRIEKNNLFNIRGEVFDNNSREPVPGVAVTCMIDSETGAGRAAESPDTETDEYGRFSLVINRDDAVNLKHARMIFHDSLEKYRHKSEMLNVESDLEVLLETSKRIASNVRVRGLVKSGIEVSKGDRIVIKASGSIKTTPISEWNGPRGLRGPSLNDGMSFGSIIGSINQAVTKIVDRHRSGALMYKLSTEGGGSWKTCGSRHEFTAKRSGKLEFTVNDTVPKDNEGGFDVSVEFQ